MAIRSALSRPKPTARRAAVGSALAKLDRGLAKQRPPIAAMAIMVEARPRRVIAAVRRTGVGVQTGRVLRTAVTIVATAETAPRRVIDPVRPTAAGVHTARVPPTAVVVATVETARHRAIALRHTVAGVHTDRVLPMAVVATTVETAPRRAIGPVRAPEAVDTDRVLLTAPGVLIPVAAARTTVVAAETPLTPAAGVVVPTVAEAQAAAN